MYQQRKCDEAKPECNECIRRNLPCPGYKKEIKWSLRHEKMLRREQPKSCVRRASSPERALFKEATNAVQQTTGAESNRSRQDSSSTASDIPVLRTDSSGGIDEEALREFLLRSDQASENFTPWMQQDAMAPIPSLLDLDMPMLAENAFGWSDDTVAHNRTMVDLDGLDVSATQPFTPGWQTQVFQQADSGEDEDEQIAVQQSLSTWRRSVSKPTPTSLVDVTTFLIDHWFRDVCPQWSAFDSTLNPNRVHMSRIWTNSRAVLHCMKTMAATTLMSTLPHLKQEAIASARVSVQAIGEDLASLDLEQPQKKLEVPLDLCLALLCVGTTMCWLDTNLLGLAYWKEARRLRDFFNDNYHLLDEEERQKLRFFENSCVYWDMLCSVVSNEDLDIPSSEDAIIGCSPPVGVIKPHPWTGVAYKQQRMLSRTIALCRRHRLRMRKARTKDPGTSPEPAAEDLMDAYLLSNELENMDVPSPQSVLDMGDRLSPSSHFSHLAVAFRIASLLQLHQTFRLNMDAEASASEADAVASQRRLVLKLALELCAILEEIPVSSNTRCTQPILYITAASGLRFETMPKDDPFSLTPEVLEVHRARSFILDRFASLQRSLPPKPIIVATDLVQAIWRAYEDEDTEKAMNCHWIDVMIDERLSTLFG